MSLARMRRRALIGMAGAVVALALPLGLTATITDASATTQVAATTRTTQVAKTAVVKKTVAKPKTPKQIARTMMKTRHHWTSKQQWVCLKALWNRESGWHVHAGSYNGAYGIPQALPGSKMGRGAKDSARVQIRWGLGYIKHRYGSPCGAEGHQARTGWY